MLNDSVNNSVTFSAYLYQLSFTHSVVCNKIYLTFCIQTFRITFFFFFFRTTRVTEISQRWVL